MGDSYITWGILICYGGFPYNMGNSHVIWVFPAVGNNGNNGNNGNKGEKKNKILN